jgi:photosystem II stability/assembly factor-like uncharacterized protein
MAFFMKYILLTYLLYIIPLAISAQWKSVQLNTSASFRALKSFQNEIWIGGTKGVYIHSKDEGKTWEINQVPGAENLDFRDLIIIDKNKIILMSAGPSEKEAAKLFKTSDGGLSWELILHIKEPNFFFDAITWDYKQKIGYLLSDPVNNQFIIFKISESGSKIKQINLINFPSLLKREAAFAASGSSLLWINKKLNIVSGGGHHARIFQSIDYRLESWKITNSEIPADTTSGYFSIGAKNKNHFWVAGGNYLKINTSQTPILESTNAGKTWKPIPYQIPVNFYIEKVVWSNPYWITSGPAGSFAFHSNLNQWKKLSESHFHNVIATKNKFIGVGAKGQIASFNKSDLHALFLPKK